MAWGFFRDDADWPRFRAVPPATSGSAAGAWFAAQRRRPPGALIWPPRPASSAGRLATPLAPVPWDFRRAAGDASKKTRWYFGAPNRRGTAARLFGRPFPPKPRRGAATRICRNVRDAVPRRPPDLPAARGACWRAAYGGQVGRERAGLRGEPRGSERAWPHGYRARGRNPSQRAPRNGSGRGRSAAGAAPSPARDAGRAARQARVRENDSDPRRAGTGAARRAATRGRTRDRRGRRRVRPGCLRTRPADVHPRR